MLDRKCRGYGDEMLKQILRVHVNAPKRYDSLNGTVVVSGDPTTQRESLKSS
jgi:hypothetical protein